MSIAISETVARVIFTVLEDTCGAGGRDCESFVEYVGKDLSRHEFRFGGNLGSGGKFHNDGEDWRVSCYAEDWTVERSRTIAQANEELSRLREMRILPGFAQSVSASSFAMI